MSKIGFTIYVLSFFIFVFFIIKPCFATSTTYNFTAAQKSAYGHYAKYQASSGFAPYCEDFTNDATDANYNQINVSDSTRWGFSSGVCGDVANGYEQKCFAFNISEDVADIYDLKALWEGYAHINLADPYFPGCAGPSIAFRIRNVTAGNWYTWSTSYPSSEQWRKKTFGNYNYNLNDFVNTSDPPNKWVYINVRHYPGTTLKGVSCPFVYSWNGEKYVFDNAAITAYGSFEESEGWQPTRLPNIKQDGTKYKLKVKEVLDEDAYIDAVDLLLVKHPEDVEVYRGFKPEVIKPDLTAPYSLINTIKSFSERTNWLLKTNDLSFMFKLYTIKDPIKPIKAEENGNDMMKYVKEDDGIYWNKEDALDYFKKYYQDKDGDGLADSTNPEELYRYLELTYPKPDVDKAKLLIGFQEGELMGWGSAIVVPRAHDYGLYDIDTFLKYIFRELMFRIEIWNGEKWVNKQVVVDYPAEKVSVVVPLDLSDIHTKDLKIRFHSAPGIGELDYAWIDYSGDVPIEIERIPLVKVEEDNLFNNLKTKLSYDDKNRIVLRGGEIEDEVNLVFDSEVKDKEGTLFLNMKGYYLLYPKSEDKAYKELDKESLRKILEVPTYSARYWGYRWLEKNEECHNSLYTDYVGVTIETLPDVDYPTFSDNWSKDKGYDVTLFITVDDNIQLHSNGTHSGMYRFSHNASSVWENSSWTEFTSAPQTINYSITLNNFWDTVAWKVYVNDTYNGTLIVSPEYYVTKQNLTSCSDLNIKGKYYFLKQSVSTTQCSCINITASYVYLNCDGNSVSIPGGCGLVGAISVTGPYATIDRCTGIGVYGIHLQSGDYGLLKNSVLTSSSCLRQLEVDSSYNEIRNVTAGPITGAGDYVIEIRGQYNTFTNSTVKDSTTGFPALEIRGSHNIITNSSIYNNVEGIQLWTSSTTNVTISNNKIYNNNVGIYIPSSFSGNKIYKNLFNNTINAQVGTVLENSWNTTKQEGGGNYWTNSTGNGYSDTCADVSPEDGFCDEPYPLNTNNMDYLPLYSGVSLPSPPPKPLPPEDITKYFLGFGFDVGTSWNLWEKSHSVTYGTDTENYVNITGVKDFLREKDIFSLIPEAGLDNYYFKIRKIWRYPDRVDIQPLNKSFYFKDFAQESPKGNGTDNTINYIIYDDGHASMTTNGSAIWISDFPQSDEYRTLVKAAIASRVDEWTTKKVSTTKETTTVSSFYSLCCDMPETAELEITLWYIV
jgi:parallel beta-helix repeat protein